jgi:hypothetical protein
MYWSSEGISCSVSAPSRRAGGEFFRSACAAVGMSAAFLQSDHFTARNHLGVEFSDYFLNVTSARKSGVELDQYRQNALVVSGSGIDFRLVGNPEVIRIANLDWCKIARSQMRHAEFSVVGD